MVIRQEVDYNYTEYKNKSWTIRDIYIKIHNFLFKKEIKSLTR